MTAVAKVDIRAARQRAGQIRQGIHTYLETLVLIQQAWDQEDWRTLAYDSWEAYVDGEFGEERLRLPRAHRDKAVQELRLAGMSARAIGSAIGEPKSTVNDSIRRLSETGQLEQPERVGGRDGRTRPATQPDRERTVDQPEPDPAEEPAPGLDPRPEDIPESEAGGDAWSPPAGDSSPPGGSGRGRAPEPSQPPQVGSGAPNSNSHRPSGFADQIADEDAGVQDAEMRRRANALIEQFYAGIGALPAKRLAAVADDDLLGRLERMVGAVKSLAEEIYAARRRSNMRVVS